MSFDEIVYAWHQILTDERCVLFPIFVSADIRRAIPTCFQNWLESS